MIRKLQDQPAAMPTRARLLAAARRLMLGAEGAQAVTMRGVAARAGVTAMAIYKHFPDRGSLLQAVVDAEYRTIGRYFRRANARRDIPGLRGMLGYLNYACDHPQLFRYMFAGPRSGAATFPGDLTAGKSPTFTILVDIVEELMARGILRSDDAPEVSLAIWAHAHGLISLFLSGRIALSRRAFRSLYLRSLGRLWTGVAAARSGKSGDSHGHEFGTMPLQSPRLIM
jgi:AcrR family transcriptional regulator